MTPYQGLEQSILGDSQPASIAIGLNRGWTAGRGRRLQSRAERYRWEYSQESRKQPRDRRRAIWRSPRQCVHVCGWQGSELLAASQGRPFDDTEDAASHRDLAPFFFNPLIPPKGTASREWLKKLIEVMQHAYFLGEGVALARAAIIERFLMSGAFGRVRCQFI